MGRSDLAIIIPAYNEEATIAKVIAGVRKHGIAIVVNDGSRDRTAEKAAEAGAVVVTHPANAGYDAALNSGFNRAAELQCKYAITIDADGQHDPALIERYRELLDEHSMDMVLGVRSRKRLLSEYVFAWVTRFRYGIHDPLCGLKGYSLTIYRRLGHFDSYKSIGTELALSAARCGSTFAEVDVPIRERQGASRFGWGFRANYKVFRALILSFVKR